MNEYAKLAKSKNRKSKVAWARLHNRKKSERSRNSGMCPKCKVYAEKQTPVLFANGKTVIRLNCHKCNRYMKWLSDGDVMGFPLQPLELPQPPKPKPPRKPKKKRKPATPSPVIQVVQAKPQPHAMPQCKTCGSPCQRTYCGDCWRAWKRCEREVSGIDKQFREMFR